VLGATPHEDLGATKEVGSDTHRAALKLISVSLDDTRKAGCSVSTVNQKENIKIPVHEE
jgi:hypothetical protein